MTPESPTEGPPDPLVNIIYIRDTVPGLMPFLETLIAHTTWRFRLVANGCDARGVSELEHMAERHAERIQVHVASTDELIPHGAMLDRLLTMETGPYFCFVDSDVFATGDTDVAELVPGDGESFRWTGLPLWQSATNAVMPTHHRRFNGPFVRTDDGTAVAGTYVACFRTAPLRAVIDRYGIGFDDAAWDDLPATVQTIFEQRGLRKVFFDTGQVIGLLIEGSPTLTYRDVPTLLHVGNWRSRSGGRRSLKSRIGRSLQARLPLVYRIWAVVWVVTEGTGWRETGNIARVRCQQARALRTLDLIGDGTMSFDEAPDWVRNEEMYDDLRDLLKASALERRPDSE